MFSDLLGLAPAKIVNRVAGRSDEIDDLFDTRLTRIASFGCYARRQPESHQTKQDGIQNMLIFPVKWTIYKYVSIKFRIDQFCIYLFGGNGSFP